MVSLKKEFIKDWHRLPNLTTGARLIMSPLPGALLIIDPADATYRWIAAILFIIVVATDALDGYLARSRNEVTTLGKLFDPLVDKVLIILTLLALSIVIPLIWVPTIIIIMREVTVTAWRARAKKRGLVVAASRSGKVKMVTQSVAIALLLLPMSLDEGIWESITVVAVIVAVYMTIVSWVEYYSKFSER